MAHLAYQPGRNRPDYCGIYHADILTGVYAFGAISAALYQRQLSGKGQHIDVSMLELMLTLTPNEVQNAQFEVAPPSRPMFGPVETADGYVMVAIASEKTFQGLVRAAGHPEWIGDSRFAKYADRRRHWNDLMDGVENWSRTVTTENCLAELVRARRSLFGLSNRGRSDGRSADRPSRRTCGSGRRRRHLQGHEHAVPDVRRQGRGGKARAGARRTYPRLLGESGLSEAQIAAVAGKLPLA